MGSTPGPPDAAGEPVEPAGPEYLRRAQRVLERCDVLARCTTEAGRITRPFPSVAMHEAHETVRGWMEAAGLTARIDAVGNLIGRLPARDPHAPTLLIGSHLDSVRDAGRYDGVLGVMAALDVAEALADHSRSSGHAKSARLPFHLDVIGFCDEEGLRFGATYFGSLAVTNAFPLELLEVEDDQGVTLGDALAASGYDPEAIPSAAYDRNQTVGFLELHIEQGPRLEHLDQPLGVATAIAGQTKMHVTFVGRAAHAGTTPMELRQDALAGAAEWVLAVERRAGETAGLVATVGSLHVTPGALNVVAGAAVGTLDLRHSDDRERMAAVRDVLAAATEIARKRRLDVTHETLVDDPSTPLDAGFTERLARAAGGPTMVSGAGHDASVMSRFAASALLFVRSPGGVSHHPDERVLVQDVAEALRAIDGFVLGLAEHHA